MNISKLTVQIGILCAVVLGVAGYLVFSPGRNTFPDLPAGSYVGSAAGFGASSDESSNFYLERLPDSNLFIAVIFSEGFHPQAVNGVESSPGRFEPLTLMRGDVEAQFVGSGSGGEYSGKIRFGSERSGRWSVRAVTADELLGMSYDDRFSVWIEEKARLRVARREGRALDDRLREGELKRDKLKVFLQNQSLLKERAKLKRDTLAAELEAGLQERKTTATAINDLVGQLELVGRISKTGQAVALARRISNRENQWYLANWGEEAEEDLPLEESGVDRTKLDAAVKQAEEVRALLRQIESEEKRIRELEQELDTQIQVAEPISPNEPEQPRKPRSLWDKLFQ